MAKRDYYEVLGVSKDASQVEIKKAYRQKAIKYYSKYASSEIYANEGNFLIAELYYDHKKYQNAKKIYTDLLSKNYKTEIIKDKLKNLEK